MPDCSAGSGTTGISIETESRLRQLLKDFAWGSLRSILPSFGVERVPHGASVALPYQW